MHHDYYWAGVGLPAAQVAAAAAAAVAADVDGRLEDCPCFGSGSGHSAQTFCQEISAQ